MAGPLVDDQGHTVAPRRAVAYDTVVIAVGSVVNDFGTPGVRAHAVALDTAEDARRFHRRLLATWARNELQHGGAGATAPVNVAIVGGGATGVELAAELMESTAAMAGFLPHMSRAEGGEGDRGARLPVRIHLLEAGERLLSALPADVAEQARADLLRRGVVVRTGVKVTAVTDTQVMLGDEAVPADLTVWAAGIRGPELLKQLDGLALSRSGQLLVGPTLQTTLDPRVLAIGDCASCPQPPGQSTVPPRAQAAHQQAQLLAEALPGFVRGEPLPAFRYDDRGSLVSLGRRHAVGQVHTPAPGPQSGRGWRLEGLLARWAYWGLQRQHMVTLHGLPRTALATLGGWLTARTMPPVKLH
ncbi:FAD-dependent oxidoreductase [Aquincola sp. J276]|uniref:NAD(P)/FAD-dependent oxidoreductase n=1 Tax=Aquincola sp. J276 TaxID=2898432 RepID=UPI002151C26E|nr:FAD-dependent oxidoreductase [Aquincola sp. J276]MCR5868747.1 FAD-dependent oxidoreductase [Aquincola sp. J276]